LNKCIYTATESYLKGLNLNETIMTKVTYYKQW